MFKNILVPTDGSATALRAAQEVAALVGGDAAVTITAVLAVEPLTTENSDYDAEFVACHNAKMQEKAELALHLTCQAFTERGASCRTKVIQGDPVSAAIATEAATGGYDLIAMGSRGLGMQKTDLHYLGSVTEHVIRRVSLPVLVIPTQHEK